MRISTCNLSFLFVSLLLLCHSFSLESPLFIDWDLQSEWVENHELHRWVSGKEQKHNIFINKESSSWQVLNSRFMTMNVSSHKAATYEVLNLLIVPLALLNYCNIFLFQILYYINFIKVSVCYIHLITYYINYIYYTQNILLILSKLNNKIDNKNYLVLDDGF